MKRFFIILLFLGMLVPIGYADVTISTSNDWGQGEVNKTSYERADNSSSLGLGYSPDWIDQVFAFYRLDNLNLNNKATVKDWSRRDNDAVLHYNGSSNGDVASNPDSIFSTKGLQSEINSNNKRVEGIRVINEDGLGINFTDEMTVAFWVNFTSFNTGESGGTDRQHPFDSPNGYIRVDGSGNLLWYDQSNNQYDTGKDLQTGRYYHIAFSETSNEIKIYVNGRNIYNASDIGVATGLQSEFSFMSSLSYTFGQENVEGYMDELLITNDTISDKEAEKLFINGRTDPFDGTYKDTVIQNSSGEQPTEWNITTTLNNQNVNGSLIVSDDNTTVKDSVTYSLSDGQNSFDVSNISSGEYIKTNFSFKSGNETETAEIDSYTISTTDTADTTDPTINITSPTSQTYNVDTVDLNVTADETIDTWKYSLNGGSNTTFTPNTTLSGLSDGSYNVTVYGNDTAGNIGNDSVLFSINTPSLTVNQSVNDTWFKPNQSVRHTISGNAVSGTEWNITINGVRMDTDIILGSSYTTAFNETYNVTNTSITHIPTGNNVSVNGTNTYTLNVSTSTLQKAVTDTFTVGKETTTQPDSDLQTPEQSMVVLVFGFITIGLLLYTVSQNFVFGFISGFFVFGGFLMIHLQNLFYDQLSILFVLMGIISWVIMTIEKT